MLYQKAPSKILMKLTNNRTVIVILQNSVSQRPVQLKTFALEALLGTKVFWQFLNKPLEYYLHILSCHDGSSRIKSTFPPGETNRETVKDDNNMSTTFFFFNLKNCNSKLEKKSQVTPRRMYVLTQRKCFWFFFESYDKMLS